MNFELISEYQPTGDQPEAIAQLTEGVLEGVPAQTLLGVTGSGKTFTIANVIKNINKPTLILSHNKTLAAQLYGEFKSFFPNNAVEYYVSYYDYYQPEAYLPSSDTYIEKDLAINEEIDKLRLAGPSAPPSGAAASKSKKKKSKTEEVAKPKVDKYTKMFVNDKSCLTAKGPFLTVHKLKGKLYVEVPLKTIGREMLIASTISEASDTNLGTIGYKPTDPIHVKFTRIDTTIYLSQAVVPPVHDTNDPHMSKAIGRSTPPPSLH